jgi:hypothetical protein
VVAVRGAQVSRVTTDDAVRTEPSSSRRVTATETSTRVVPVAIMSVEVTVIEGWYGGAAYNSRPSETVSVVEIVEGGATRKPYAGMPGPVASRPSIQFLVKIAVCANVE